MGEAAAAEGCAAGRDRRRRGTESVTAAPHPASSLPHESGVLPGAVLSLGGHACHRCRERGGAIERRVWPRARRSGWCVQCWAGRTRPGRPECAGSRLRLTDSLPDSSLPPPHWRALPRDPNHSAIPIKQGAGLVDGPPENRRQNFVRIRGIVSPARVSAIASACRRDHCGPADPKWAHRYRGGSAHVDGIVWACVVKSIRRYSESPRST